MLVTGLSGITGIAKRTLKEGGMRADLIGCRSQLAGAGELEMQLVTSQCPEFIDLPMVSQSHRLHAGLFTSLKHLSVHDHLRSPQGESKDNAVQKKIIAPNFDWRKNSHTGNNQWRTDGVC